MPFYVDPNPSPSEISDAINYLLANVNTATVGNQKTGQIIGSNGQVVGYLYKYMNVKYSTSFDGTQNFSNSPTNATYYGLRNSDSNIESTTPSEYIWYQATGGFGTTKYLWYLISGGRSIQFVISTSKPADGYYQDSGSAIDLDNISVSSINSSYVIIYRTANNSSQPTNAEFQAAIGRNPISGDTATINYNSGTQSIQYKFTTTWAVLTPYITGDIIVPNTVQHSSLAGLQGGTTSQYYHLTNAQYTVATQAATSSLNGYLTSTDWTTFNNKQNALSNASASVSGILTSTDWTTFNNKQPSGSYAVVNTAVTFSSMNATGLASGATVQATTAGGYKSSDGSSGYTGTLTTASLVGKTVTIKDGLIVSII